MRHHKTSLHSSAQRAQPRFRIERWHRYSLYALLAGLWLSGLIWLLVRYTLRTVTEYGEVPHAAEHPLMQLHGALLWFWLFLWGSLLLQHIRRAHQAQRNRRSGWTLISLLLIVSLSAYGLYYLAAENSRPVWSWLHAGSGIVLPLILFWHIRRGRRQQA
ncbi:DUF4405 domain-containing protein [Undibacterium luofuense]|uniref:DUF4405 domain-containing protein n=1 Tax=Undibacterium luofuense TaxID=2828733 RepID=UPI0030EEFA6E